jgi:hypothetical protein
MSITLIRIARRSGIPYSRDPSLKMIILLLGGNLKFSSGTNEVYPPRPHLDNQSNLFIHSLIGNGFIDIESIKLIPTWKNMWTGENRVAKRLNRLLISEKLSDLPLQFT